MAVSARVFDKGGDKKVVYVFIEGKAGYNNIIFEDTEYGGYKMQVIVEPEDLVAIEAIIEEHKSVLIDVLAEAAKGDMATKLDKASKVPLKVTTKPVKIDGTEYENVIHCKSKFQPSLTVGEDKFSSKLDNLEKVKKFSYIKRFAPVTVMVELYPYSGFGGGVATRVVNVTVPTVDCTGQRLG